MERKIHTLGVVALLGVLSAIGAAQGPGRLGANWPTVGADAQRTFWMRNESRVSSRGAWSPQFRLLWKTTLDNQPAQLNALTQPLLLENIISHKGFKALAFVGGSGDNVYAIDYELNRIYWKRHLDTAVAPQNASLTCPGGLMTVTRAATIEPPLVGRSPAASKPPPPPLVPSGFPATGAGNNAPITNAIYAVSSAGMLHALNPHIGDDIVPPVKFLPPSAKVAGSILIDYVLYAATADQCGGAPNGVWAVDLANQTKPITKWETGGGSIVGSAGLAFGTNGTIYAATDGVGTGTFASSLVALEARTLALKDHFNLPKSGFATSPLTFSYKDRELVIAGNRDGRLYVLDGASLGGSDHLTPLSKTSPYSSALTGSLATWEDADGTRWVVAAASGAIQSDTTFPTTNGAVSKGSVVAFKLVDRNGAPTLEPAWASRDLASPLPPMVMNDVIFAVASGLEPPPTGQTSAADQVSHAKPAVVYALDARTGKELWNSGSTITSFATAVPPSGGDSQVYVVTYDGTLYTFGLPVER
jgi:outer membrane protein assembly factor BamB